MEDTLLVGIAGCAKDDARSVAEKQRKGRVGDRATGLERCLRRYYKRMEHSSAKMILRGKCIVSIHPSSDTIIPHLIDSSLTSTVAHSFQCSSLAFMDAKSEYGVRLTFHRVYRYSVLPLRRIPMSSFFLLFFLQSLVPKVRSTFPAGYNISKLIFIHKHCLALS